MSTLRVPSAAGRSALAALALITAVLAAWAAGGAASALKGLIGGPEGLVFGLVVGLAMLPFWIGGVCLVGGPLWLALHLSGRRDRETAMIFGALAAAFGGPAVLILLSGDAADPNILLLAPPAAISGAVLGYAVWLLRPEGQA